MNTTQCFLICWRNMRQFVNVVLLIGHIPHGTMMTSKRQINAENGSRDVGEEQGCYLIGNDCKRSCCVSQKLIEEAKSSFYKNKINACDDKGTLKLPRHNDVGKLTERFCIFSHLRYPKIVINWILTQSLKIFILRGHTCKVRRRSNFWRNLHQSQSKKLENLLHVRRVNDVIFTRCQPPF